MIWPATADQALLDRPLRGLDDVAAIEAVPIDARLGEVDFARRVDMGLAARAPGDAAIIFVPDGNPATPPHITDFATLRDNIARTAAMLRARGIGRDDVVAVLLPNMPQIYWAILGAMTAGIVFPPNWMMEPSALAALLRQANARAVIALGPTPGFRIWESLGAITGELPIFSVPGPGGTLLPDRDFDTEIARHAPAAMAPHAGEAIGAIVHSGGTTGAPKLVKLSHRNMAYRHWTLQLASRLGPNEVHLHDTPMFHVGGLVGRTLPPLACGATMLIPSILGARDRGYMANYWRFVEKYRVARLSGVPTTLAVLAKSAPPDLDRSALQPYFMTGSTALPAAVRDEFERVSGVRVLNSYGMTENTASIAVDPRDGGRRDGASGIRLPYTQIRAVALNDGTRVCGPDEIGMLHIKGPGLAQGYVDPAQMAASRSTDGWLVTGDLGRIDEAGFVFVTGRAKDVIIRGGHNIDPALIEECLLAFPAVLHAAAVGRPDAYAGEVPVAYVQLADDAAATPAGLLAAITGRIAERAAIPKQIIIMDRLPLSDVGKPLKDALRRDIAERHFGAMLREATGAALDVAAIPDPRRGLVLRIRPACVPASREALAARIATAMAPYATPYDIEWEE